jgi:hypothetical protein
MATITTKLDLYREHSEEYAAPKKPTLIRMKPATYLAITGRGAPGGDEFQRKIGALYAVAYTCKFASKFAGRDYAVCKLEALWWGNRGESSNFATEPKANWNWQLIIRTPAFVGRKQLADAMKSLIEKGKPVVVREVQLVKLREGLCVQMLHVGPYEEEERTVAQMLKIASDDGLAFRGKHHEIYLSDPRRVAPAKLKTILRLPVVRKK